MTADKIDPLVKVLAQAEPSYRGLQNLEGNVWRAIHKCRAELQPRNVIEELLSRVFVPEYRFASIMVAIMAGFFAAYIGTSSQQPVSASVGLNLGIFSSDYGSSLQAMLRSEEGEKS